MYCASVHAERFEQLAKRNDVIKEVFRDPALANSTPRDQAIIRFSAALTLHPDDLDLDDLRALRAQELDDLQILDLINVIAVFAWANRLMLNLGAPTNPPSA